MPSDCKQGFSLLELMVAVTIIGILGKSYSDSGKCENGGTAASQ